MVKILLEKVSHHSLVFRFHLELAMLFVNGVCYTTEKINIRENQLGYIYRWRQSPRSGETRDCGHSGCILPKGQFVGFGFDQLHAVLEANAIEQTLEKGLRGNFMFNDALPPRYIDIRKAISTNTQSSIIILQAGTIQVEAFNNYWKQNPGSYSRLTRNCSTVCYEAFRSAGLVKFSIAPVMTPKRLYNLLAETCKSRSFEMIERNGFAGIDSNSQGNFDLIIAQPQGRSNVF